MPQLLEAVAGNAEARVLIVRGRTDVFLTGASAEGLRAIVGRPGLRRSPHGPINHLTLAQFANFPLPVVGALEGHAVGGGLSFALALCDVTIAAESSRYGFNYAGLGFTPGMASHTMLPAYVGHAFANEMLLTAKLYRGGELQHRGLFTHVVPKEADFQPRPRCRSTHRRHTAPHPGDHEGDACDASPAVDPRRPRA
ncbi:MAG TPA: enoyl-CoA hydratase-related protein [Myxococcota bacterium]|nr:enoyl-CoA hydratase-related protein [Myxococcota bacterium]